MAPDTSTIIVHQLLHGYDSGHKLLAGSCELPVVVARKILVQSDLSGSIPPKGFETYLTAYPLREVDAYAFARTWYAPEMPRPGCVWTHTLLIKTEDVGNVPTLRLLLDHFRRPLSGNYLGFRDPIQARISNAKSGGSIRQSDCEDLLRVFYGPEKVPVVMGSSEQAPVEDLFLEVWAQLWPEARLDLTLSTGSLSARKFEMKPFDLQLAPANAVREVVRTSNAAFAQGNEQPVPDELGVGISALVSDIISRGDGGLRKFLTEIAGVSFERRNAPSAALIYKLSKGESTLTEDGAKQLLCATAEAFPLADTGEALKRRCIEAIGRSGIPEVERWIVIQIATGDYADAFASPAIGLSEQMTRLIKQDSEGALDLLLRLFDRSSNRLGEQIAHAIISTLSESQLLTFLRHNRQFLSTFVRVRPGLAANVEFWTAFSFNSHEILEAVAGANEPVAGGLKRVFSAIFEAQLDHEANHFFSLFGPAAVAAMFEHRGSLPAKLRDRWTDALTARADLVEAFLTQTEIFTPEILAGVSATYSPARASTGTFPLDHWLAALANWHASFAPELGATVETCSFSLALALRHTGEKAAELCRLSFQNAYAAAAAESMSYSAWSMLEPLMPHISWLRDWDRCERMRRALILRFESNQWPLAYLFRILHAPNTLHEFGKSASTLPEGRRLIGRVVEAIERGTVSVETAQVTVLANATQVSIRPAHQ